MAENAWLCKHNFDIAGKFCLGKLLNVDRGLCSFNFDVQQILGSTSPKKPNDWKSCIITDGKTCVFSFYDVK